MMQTTAPRITAGRLPYARRTYMKEYTAETIEKTIAARDRAQHALRELLRSYMGIRSDGSEYPEEDGVRALIRDIRYDPDPYISTMDYTPADRAASLVHPLWTEEMTKRLSDISGDLLADDIRAENIFRWNRTEIYSLIMRAADASAVSLPEVYMPDALSFYCPYAFARLYMSGATGAGSGVLLRRVNCRPWGIKPIGTL